MPQTRQLSITRRVIAGHPGAAQCPVNRHSQENRAMLHQSNARPLRLALFANAVFSTLCAYALVFETDRAVATLFVSDTAWPGLPLRHFAVLLGAGLFVFAGLVAWAAARRSISRGAVKAIIGADVLWVIAGFALLPVSGSVLTETGFWTALIVDLIVLMFAVEQALGLTMLYQGQSALTVSADGRVRRFRLSHAVDASAQAAWRVMTDHEAYADVADNLSKVEVLRGEAKGMRRKCHGVKGESWTEQAHIWDEGKRYGFTVDTDAPGYPYPLEKLAAVWSVEPRGAHASDVTMAFEVTPQSNLRGALFMLLSNAMFPKVIDRLLARWAVRMERLHGAE
ncbi:MAG: SRPBCC family protein [Minwuiales bacterium]|nr:SRPBCC family protein [Minwuiales bacterium]